MSPLTPSSDSNATVVPNTSTVRNATGFRVNACNFSITWPQSNFDINDALRNLQSKTVGAARVVEVIISSEQHEDGNYHRHAFVRFNRRVDIRNSRFFDWEGRHANVQRTVNVPAWKNYIRKDGTFVDWVEPNQDIDDEPDDLFELARNTGNEAFFNLCRKKGIPFAYASHAWRYARSEQSLVTFETDPCPDLNLTLSQDLAEYTFDEGEKTNVIIGPSGCGKTVTAIRKMKKPLLLVRHMDTLQHFDAHLHKSILFDDMAFTHLHRTSQIHLVDRTLPSALHRRYGTALIPANTQVSITGNEPPLNLGDAAIARRCNVVYLDGWDEPQQ
nr:Rep [Forsythia suspensa CRESS virus]